MVDKSNLGLIIITSLVLVLSFKDLVLTNTHSVQEEKSVKSKENELRTDSSSFENDHLNNNDFETEHESSMDSLDDAHEIKKIPSLKMKSNVQTLKILYCYSCGYRNAFEQYSQLIKSRFPELNIIGENYSTSGYKLVLAQFISMLKMVLIGLVISGQNPFTYFNLQTPNIFNWATQNKLYACLMIFFLSNAIETNLITSGAFEIYLNDMQVWSKLQSDRMPHEKELMQILDMNFNFEEKNAFGTNNPKF